MCVVAGNRGGRPGTQKPRLDIKDGGVGEPASENKVIKNIPLLT